MNRALTAAPINRMVLPEELRLSAPILMNGRIWRYDRAANTYLPTPAFPLHDRSLEKLRTADDPTGVDLGRS